MDSEHLLEQEKEKILQEYQQDIKLIILLILPIWLLIIYTLEASHQRLMVPEFL